MSVARIVFRFGLVGLCTVALVIFLCTWMVTRHRSDIATMDTVVPTDVALVLGAHVLPNNEPSDILRDRLLTAVALYDASIVKTILVSADNGQESYDEVNAMRMVLLREGVAPEDIFLDHAGFDTYDSMYRAANVFGARSLIVVTQRYHLPRALYLGTQFGMDVQGIPADRQRYRRIFQYRLREVVADVKAVIEVMRGATARYGGTRIDLTGDGQQTWDEK